jgi:cellulose synthase/poly-beta-1,6-N-acetylglucosamine synthase-like glycosyltransferase
LLRLTSLLLCVILSSNLTRVLWKQSRGSMITWHLVLIYTLLATAFSALNLFRFNSSSRFYNWSFGKRIFYFSLTIAPFCLVAFFLLPLSFLIFIFILVSFIFFLLTLRFFPDWNVLSQAFFTHLLVSGGVYLTFLFKLSLASPNLFSRVLIVFTFIFTVVSLSLLYLEVFVILNVMSREKWRRIFKPHRGYSLYQPFVSLHLPICTEPPDLVKESLKALSQLDYKNFEVVVVDNNTKSKSLWKPVRDCCRKLGPRFKFYHVDELPGFKAGALNFALDKTDPKAEIVGVVDSDYIVDQNFLKATVPYFKDPQVAIVQTPQDYRDFNPQGFLAKCYWVYRYFFAFIMNSCNEYNAASFMGTMGLIRKRILKEARGWNEWCITEDVEVGLRIHQKDYLTAYLDKSFGRGLMPMEFRTFKKQRFRWTFGNMQVLRRNFFNLLPFTNFFSAFKPPLNFFQKMSYLSEATVWFNGLFGVVTLLFIIDILYLLNLSLPLFVLWALVPLFFIFIFRRAFSFLWALRVKEQISFRDALASLFAFFSLSLTMATAWLVCLMRPEGVFWRTSKFKRRVSFHEAWEYARWETIVGVLSLVLALGTLVWGRDNFRWLIATLLCSQAIIFLSSLWSIWQFSKAIDDRKKT